MEKAHNIPAENMRKMKDFHHILPCFILLCEK